MLEKVKIACHASYSESGAILDDLKPINFIFGTNGTGKTTISRVIADVQSYPFCEVSWAGSRPLETVVYNRDFVARNFKEQFPGIFTLGETVKDTLENIEFTQKNVRKLNEEVSQLQRTLGKKDDDLGMLGKLKGLRKSFEAECWKIKTKHDIYFKGAFIGVRNAQAKFCEKIIEEFSVNKSEICDFDDLKVRVSKLFNNSIDRKASIPLLDFSLLLFLEKEPLLLKRIIGREDINVSELIQKLSNSDWVRQGLSFLNDSDVCPFCQQKVEADLVERLNSYFDEKFISDIARIKNILDQYRRHSEEVLAKLKSISEGFEWSINPDGIDSLINQLSERISSNIMVLENKNKEPSVPARLESIDIIAGSIREKIEAENNYVVAHNQIVDNLSVERSRLIGEIWKWLVEENRAAIEKFSREKISLEKAISSLELQIIKKRELINENEKELRELERSVASVHPTVRDINVILKSFGFTGFSLRTSGDKNHLYEVVRGDGSNAVSTLSEGERSFVGFLYFYHLLQGSMNEAGISSDRIVVFDDPISSLDSDVLFIVSALIKRVFKDIVSAKGRIKQAFILTHNIYFHKEVSFDPTPISKRQKYESYWIVKKAEGISEFTRCEKNPIKTSYELLWDDVRSPNKARATIQNTLRRIVENYFKIMGNIDTEEIIAMFEGKDQQVCSSLFSWVNDGSHSAHEDFYISSDESIVDRYMEVFKMIFIKTNHYAHYCMMMKIEPDDVRNQDEGNLSGENKQLA
ncbi:AAA family ATPase [Azospirillum melinis]|uniref:AAA family ATPase n=1 Tax=Azospirillum melinis TaxID=328839 RepID=A0ABX2KN27_9PROT|nr:AAA family ATPase [Azospirillum melinis]MBP2310712.1 wobble nucleotide-excising tRNase [Azospirillum melinis]NUB04534.1 AAA family ATPase [Azospirillum melinis]